MKVDHQYWTIDELTKNIGKIEFPEFQREPTVWKLDKKQKLIDSILRDFDISSIYFFKKESGGYDCIDGRQRINAIFSFLGINGADEEDNGFHLKIENEIYDDRGYFSEVDLKRYKNLRKKWKDIIDNYKLNIVLITDVKVDEELNLLFLRLQIASILNAGEKLHAMTGDMRNKIFYEISKHGFFDHISIRSMRYAKEQVAAQIVLNVFSKRDTGTFRKSRYVDLQGFFKQYGNLDKNDKSLIKSIMETFDKIDKDFGNKLKYINSRALAVSIFLFVYQLIEDKKEKDIPEFVDFFSKFLQTLRWQLPQGVKMHDAYYDLLKFQTNVTQAAGEKYAIQTRHDMLSEYFYYYKEKKGLIKGDQDYKKNTGQDPGSERKKNASS
jgi:hypothetical protein